MRVSGFLAAGFGAAVLAASPASAAVMMATFYGATDFGGYDYAGLFGTPGASLAYKPVVLTFTYDTELGEPIVSPGQDTRFGGAQYGTDSPILSASITIGEASYDLDLSYYGYANSYAGEWTWLYGRQDTPGNVASEFQVTAYHDAPGNLATPFSAFAEGGGTLRLYKPNAYGELLAETDFSVGGLTVEYVGPSGAPVPEPAAWAVMILGFGLAGSALRTRRSMAA